MNLPLRQCTLYTNNFTRPSFLNRCRRCNQSQFGFLLYIWIVHRYTLFFWNLNKWTNQRHENKNLKRAGKEGRKERWAAAAAALSPPAAFSNLLFGFVFSHRYTFAAEITCSAWSSPLIWSIQQRGEMEGKDDWHFRLITFVINLKVNN